jgi:hypothetical protein
MQKFEKTISWQFIKIQNSKFDILYYGDSFASEDNPCEVRIDEGEMVFDYEENAGRVHYKGNGHFELYIEEVKGECYISYV